MCCKSGIDPSAGVLVVNCAYDCLGDSSVLDVLEYCKLVESACRRLNWHSCRTAWYSKERHVVSTRHACLHSSSDF